MLFAISNIFALENVLEVLVNCLGGLSLPRKSVFTLTDRPDMTFDVYRGRKMTMQRQLLAGAGEAFRGVGAGLVPSTQQRYLYR